MLESSLFQKCWRKFHRNCRKADKNSGIYQTFQKKNYHTFRAFLTKERILVKDFDYGKAISSEIFLSRFFLRSFID